MKNIFQINYKNYIEEKLYNEKISLYINIIEHIIFIRMKRNVTVHLVH